jgi:hypothetical protein
VIQLSVKSIIPIRNPAENIHLFVAGCHENLGAIVMPAAIQNGSLQMKKMFT